MKKRTPTAAQLRARFKKTVKPTIGIGEDDIKGRGDGGRVPGIGAGELGERLPAIDRQVEENMLGENIGDYFGDFGADDPGPDDAAGI